MSAADSAPAETMNNQTARALVALHEALAADPDGCRELQFYGALPEHLGDAVAELVEVAEQ